MAKVNTKDIIRLLAKVLDVEYSTLAQLEDDKDISTYGLDSIGAIKLIVLLEEEYCIRFDEEDLVIDSVNSINKIKATLKKYSMN